MQKFLIVLLFMPFALFAQDDARDEWQKPDAIMDSLGIRSGMYIGEAGAGSGYFTFFLAERVGETGRVYANDIDEQGLDIISSRAQKEGFDNIITIPGEVEDPLFPDSTLDMVVMMKAFHDFTEPVKWMDNVIADLKPGAKLAIIDPVPEKVDFWKSHFMSKEEVLEIMSGTGFELVHIFTFLPRDNIYLYQLKSSPD
ncbi:methyltransferase domain-containing protein [candidate division KSB1 bacterium]|nr:methyltransferase domain-containing protein [candidate division KSB1 bacterium]